MRNPGNDEVIHVDYAKHGLVLRNLGDVDVLHVDLRETLSGHEEPRERRSNTHGLRQTWSGREKPPRRRRNTPGFTKNMFQSRKTLRTTT